MSTMTDRDVIAWARDLAAAHDATGGRGGDAFRRLADLAEKATEDWQPIATAPEDTDVLVWDAECTFVLVAYRRGPHWRGTSRMQRPKRPTHWRPLPAPPGGGR